MRLTDGGDRRPESGGNMLCCQDVSCRFVLWLSRRKDDEGFDHVSRYVTGLIVSPNKTLQGIYDLQVWDRDGKKPSHQAMLGYFNKVEICLRTEFSCLENHEFR